MAEFNPIGDVGRTLRSILLDGMGTLDVDEARVALASPAQFESDDAGLSIHLYHLTENAHLANELPPEGFGDEAREPGLVLELYYLVTAHPPAGETVETGETLEQHQMLSKAIRAFHEHAIVTGSMLEGSLPPATRLQISLDPDATDHILDVWNSFQDTPYLPSVSYVVTPLVIETGGAQPGPRVQEATVDHFDGVER